MAASCQNKFFPGQIIVSLASQPTNRTISLWALAQTIATDAQQFTAAAVSSLVCAHFLFSAFLVLKEAEEAAIG